MTVNEKVKERLREYKVSVNNGMTYLLAMHHGFEPDFYPEDLVKKIYACKFFEKDPKTNTVRWLMPLFDDQVTGFEWVGDWMESFGNINKDRKGVKTYVMKRMKKYFVDHPDVRAQEVIGATNMYFRNVSAPMYLKSSHKFIMDGRGAEAYSMLDEWIEKYRNWESAGDNRTTFNTVMK